jgi:hypothetical protein
MKDRPHNGQKKTNKRIRRVWRYQRGVIRLRKSKDRQRNGWKKTGKRTTLIYKILHGKLNIEQHEPH